MPRCKQPPFDPRAAALQLAELGARRKQFIKAQIRVMNAAGALVRRALGWSLDLPADEQKAINGKAAKIVAAKDPAKLPAEMAAIAAALAAEIATSAAMAAPAEAHVKAIEKEMKKLARQFPVWEGFAKDVRGLSDLGLAVIIAEAGCLDDYPTRHKLRKRLGLAPIVKDGVAKSGMGWRLGGGLSADGWTAAGYKPSRRAQIFAQVGTLIISGGAVQARRPISGEDVAANPDYSRYQRIFMQRLRYEAAREPEMHRDDTAEGRESYSKRCAGRAQRYTEQRLLDDLWRAWRRDRRPFPERDKGCVPSAELASPLAAIDPDDDPHLASLPGLCGTAAIDAECCA